MKLSDVKLRTLATPGKHFDGAGLYLEVTAAGGRYWRLKYRHAGKEKRLALGVYPQITLKDARARAAAARQALADGTDPGAQRKADKAQAAHDARNTLQAVATDWLQHQAGRWTPDTAARIRRSLELHVFPALGAQPLSELTAPVDNKRRWFEPGACFAKGTLVHTKEGLKPIEQIQVGDWVLSKPENGGEQAYKRVLKTFAHPPQRVVQVEYMLPGQVLKELDKNNQPVQRAHLTTTLGHPIWTREEGWTAPAHMQPNGIGAFHFEASNGDEIEFWSIKNIYISDNPHVGWTSNRWPEALRGKGSLWDYAEQRLISGEAFAQEDVSWGEHPAPYFEAPVYNLEVEDFHTYYVGEHGIWVHNQNCDGWNLEVRNTNHSVNFINHVSAFTTRKELKNALTARGIDNGVVLLRAHTNSQLDELIKAGKLGSAEDAARWLKHEEAVPGRLMSNNTGERYEYAGVFKDRDGALDGQQSTDCITGRSSRWRYWPPRAARSCSSWCPWSPPRRPRPARPGWGHLGNVPPLSENVPPNMPPGAPGWPYTFADACAPETPRCRGKKEKGRTLVELCGP